MPEGHSRWMNFLSTFLGDPDSAKISSYQQTACKSKPMQPRGCNCFLLSSSTLNTEARIYIFFRHHGGVTQTMTRSPSCPDAIQAPHGQLPSSYQGERPHSLVST